MNDSNVLLPSPFYGRQTEDVLYFIRTFELWAEFRRLDKDAKRSAVPLLLKEEAARWFHTQPAEVKSDYDQLLQAFITRYGPSQATTWRRTAELWQLRQQEGQSTDDFLSSVIEAGQRIEASKEQLFSVVLNGLRPTIRQHVLQHELSDLDDIRKWARLTEQSPLGHPANDRPLSNAVREIAALREELGKLSLNAFQSTPSNSPPSRVTFRSPSPRRQRWDQRHHRTFRRQFRKSSATSQDSSDHRH